MASIFYLPKVVSLPGAKLTFSLTNTATPQAVYTDAALQVAHTQPVTADAAGVFAPIFLDPTLPNYRVKLTTSADVLIYQTDDIPSNQNVQQSMRLESTNPFVFLYDTDGTSGSRKYRVRAAGAAFEVQASNEAESVFTTILQYTGGVLYSNATEVAVTESGSFTATLTGFTTVVTVTVNYRKVNNIATIWTTLGAQGTSNTTGMTMTGFPAAIVPATGKTIACSNLEDNGNFLLSGEATFVASTLDFGIAKSNTVANYVQNPHNGFTNSGGKGLSAGWTITYPLS